MANIYFSTQWANRNDGDVVQVQGGTAIIGEDAFSAYTDAKDAAEKGGAEIVLCDVFCSSQWAGQSGEVEVEIEGDTYTLTIGENAFAAFADAVQKVGEKRYGGVYLYRNAETDTAELYYSGQWEGLAEYTVVEMKGKKIWDSNGNSVTYAGETLIIGVNAFAQYRTSDGAGAGDASDRYGDTDGNLYPRCSSDNIYINGIWDSSDPAYAEGKPVRPFKSGGETAIIGQNAFAVDISTAAKKLASLNTAAAAARTNNSALYVVGGTFCEKGTTSGDLPMLQGDINVVTNTSFVKSDEVSIVNFPPGSVVFGPANQNGTVRSYLLNGASVAGTAYVVNTRAAKGYLYVGNGAQVSSIRPALNCGTINEVEIDVDGGAVGKIEGANDAGINSLKINVRNSTLANSNIWICLDGGASFHGVKRDTSIVLAKESTIKSIKVSYRSTSDWFKSFGAKLGHISVTVSENSKLGDIGNSISWWSAASYDVTLDSGSITGTLDPGAGGALAVTGGTAVITGGTFCTPTGNGITYGEAHTSTELVDTETRYLGGMGSIVRNADGSFSVVNGVFFNPAAEAGSQYIVGGTVTYYNAVQSKFALHVKGDGASYVKTLGASIECITIDAAATLSLGGDVGSKISITIDATDFELTGAGKVVLTTTGTINATDITLLENGEKSTRYVLKKTSQQLEVIEKPIVYSVAWADLKKDTVVSYGGANYTIGTDAFGNYVQAKATGKPVLVGDRYYDPAWKDKTKGDTVDVVIDGETVSLTIEENAFTSLSAAQDAYDPSTAVVVNGGTLTGGRASVLNCAGKTTAFYNYTAIFTAAADMKPGPVICANNAGSSGRVIIGKGSHVQDVSLGRDMGVAATKDIDVTIQVKDDATATVVSGIFNKAATSSSSYTKDDSGKLVWEGGHSRAHFILTGGSVGIVTPTNYDGAYTGDIVVDVSGNAQVGTITGSNVANSKKIEGNFFVNMAGGTINKIDANAGATGLANRYFAITAGGTHTISTIGSLANMKNASGVSITVHAGNHAQLVIGGGTLSLPDSAVITIDVENFQFEEGVTEYTVLTTGGNLGKYKIDKTGTAIDECSLSVTDTTITIKAKDVYFSSAWEGLGKDTIVTTPGGTAKIGYDAFLSYDDAVAQATAKNWGVASADRYYSADWTTKGQGDEVEIVNASGTFSTRIGDAAIPAYNDFAAAKGAAGANGTTLAIVGGSMALANRTSWYGVTNTILTGGTIVSSGGSDGAVVSMMLGNQNADYEAAFTVGEDGYLATIGIKGSEPADSVFKKLTYRVKDGGRIGTVRMIGYAGNIIGDIDIHVSNGGVIDTANVSTGGGKITGNIEFNVSAGGKIGTLRFPPAVRSTVTLTADSTIKVELDGGTITAMIPTDDPGRVFAKEDGATISMHVTGNATSVIGAWSNDYFDTLTIDATANLEVAGEFAYTGTITIDATNYIAESSRKQVFSVANKFTNEYTLTGDPEGKYILVKENKALYIVAKTVVYSAAWKELKPGDTVTVNGNIYTIGTDASGNYNDACTYAQNLGRIVEFCDAYHSSEWAGKSEGDTVKIVLDGTTVSQKIGGRAFATLAGAQGGMNPAGAVVLTGGSYACTFDGVNALNGKRTVLQGGTFTGTLIAAAAGSDVAEVDVTVNGAYIAELAMGRYKAVTETAKIRVSGSTIGTLRTDTGGSDTCLTTIFVENSQVKNIGGATGTNSNEINVEIKNSTITGMIGGAGSQETSHVTGNVNFTFDGVTVTSDNGFCAARGHDNSKWKLSRVKGDITVSVKGGTSNFSVFDVQKYEANSITITIDADAALLTTRFYADAGQTFTIDVTGFTFDGAESKTVVTATTSGGLKDYNFVTTGTAADNFTLSVTNAAVSLVRKKVYYSCAWADLKPGDIVTTTDGTATIGTDAFSNYSVAKAKAEELNYMLKFCDRFYDPAFTSGTVSVILDGGTSTAWLTVGKEAFNTREGAQEALIGGALVEQNTSYNLTSSSQRFSFPSADGQYYVVRHVTDTSTKYNCDIGIGGYNNVTVRFDGDSNFKQFNTYGYVCKDLTKTIIVDDATIGNVGASGLASSAAYTVDEATGKILWSGAHGTMNFIINKDAHVSSISSGDAGSSSTGDVNVTINGSYVGAVNLEPEQYGGKFNGNEIITLNAGSVGSIVHLTGTVSSTHFLGINAKSGANYIGTLSCNTAKPKVSGISITVNAAKRATLTVNSSIAAADAGPKSITIDVDKFAFATGEDAFTVFTAKGGIAEYTVGTTGTAVDGFDLVVTDTDISISKKSVYFSIRWEGKTGTVEYDGKTLTMGVDAFGNYADAQAKADADKKIVTSGDVYLNSTYNATDPIEIPSGTATYTAKFGKDAFADVTQAPGAVKAGGALRVTGGEFGNKTGGNSVTLDVDYLEIKDTAIYNTLHGKNGAETDVKMMISGSTIGNGFYAAEGAIQGNVDVTLSNVNVSYVSQTVGRAYIVCGNVTGDVNVTLDNGTKFFNDIYIVNTGATVGGDVSVTLGDVEINKNGLVNKGTVSGSTLVTVAGTATVTAITDFADININENAALVLGGTAVTGNYSNSGTLRLTNDIFVNVTDGNYVKIGAIGGTGSIVINDSATVGVYKNGDIYYTATQQSKAYFNGDYAAKTAFDKIDVAGGSAFVGVNAFANFTDASGKLADNAALTVTGGTAFAGVAGSGNMTLAFANDLALTVTGNVSGVKSVDFAGKTVTFNNPADFSNVAISLTCDALPTDGDKIIFAAGNFTYKPDQTCNITINGGTEPVVITDVVIGGTFTHNTKSYTLSSENNQLAIISNDYRRPVISVDNPGATWQKTSVNVVVTFEEGSYPIAEQKYRINHGAWIECGATETITVSDYADIEFYAKDNRDKDSSLSVKVLIDKLAPVIESVTPGKTGWTNQDFELTVSDYDRPYPETEKTSGIATREYQFDGGDWTEFTGNTVSTAEKGNGTYRFRVTDHAGNVTTSEIQITNIDKIAPTITVTATPALDKWTNDKVTVTATFADPLDPVTGMASGIAKKEYSLDGGATFAAYTAPYVFTKNGSIVFRTTDNAGNVTTSQVYTVDHIDTIVPTITVTTDRPLDTWTKEDITVTATFADPLDPVTGMASGIAKKEYSLDGGTTFAAYTAPYVFTKNGTIVFRATDNAGNVTKETITVDHIDKVPPTITVTAAPALDKWTNDKVTLAATFTDDLSQVKTQEYKIGDGTWQTYQTPITVESNNTTIYFRATDNAGNTQEKVVYDGTERDRIVVDHIDKIVPTITVTTDRPLDKWTNKDVTVTATFTDPLDPVSGMASGIAKKEYSLDGGTTFTSYTAPYLFEQNGTIVFRTTDKAGNVTTSQVYTVDHIDKIAPTITDIKPSTTDWTNKDVTITVKFADKGGSQLDLTQYKIGDGAWQNYSGLITVTANAKVSFQATDHAGNKTTASYTVSNIDKVPPTITVTTAPVPLDTWTNTPVIITAKFTDDLSQVKTQEYKIGNGAWQTYQTPITVANNNTTVYFRATDYAGNKQEKVVYDGTERDRIVVDHIDYITPELTSGSISVTPVTPGHGDWADAKGVNISFDCRDEGGSLLAECRYRLNEGAWKTMELSGAAASVNIKGIKANGKVSIKVIDHAGNELNMSTTVDHIDGEMPTVTFDPAEGESPWTNQTFTLWVKLEDKISGLDPAECKYTFVTATGDTTEGVCKPEQKIDCVERGTVTVIATDKAGNQTVAEYEVSNIDKEDPTIKVSSDPKADEWTNGTVAVRATISDNLSGVATRKYKISQNGEWIDYANKSELVFSENTTVYFRATDKAGNLTEESFSVENIDTIAPTIGYISQDTTKKATSVTVTAQFFDFESGIASQSYRFDNGEWRDYNDALGVTVEKNCKITFRAIDKAGNETLATHEVTNIANAPTITVKMSPNTWTNQTVQVSASAKSATGSAVTLSYGYDGKVFQKYTGAISVSSAKTVYFKAVDAEGGESTNSVDVLIDKIAPTISDIRQDVTAQTTKPVRISAVFSDDESGIATREYQIGAGDWQTYSGNGFTVSGNGVVSLRATDKAGNETVTTYEVTNFKGPDISVTATPASWTKGTVTLTAKFTTSSGGSIKTKEYSLDGFLWTAYKSPVAINANGTVYFRATDTKGMAGSYSYEVGNIDRVLPTLSAKAAAKSGNWRTGSLTVTATYKDTLSGLKKCEYSTDGKSWKAFSVSGKSYSASFDVKGGGKYYLRATDVAGNVKTATYTATLNSTETVTTAVSTSASSVIKLKSLTVSGGSGKLTLGKNSSLTVSDALTLAGGTIVVGSGAKMSAEAIHVTSKTNAISGIVSGTEMTIASGAKLTVGKSLFDKMLAWDVFDSKGTLSVTGGTLTQANIQKFIAKKTVRDVTFDQQLTGIHSLTLSGTHKITVPGGVGTSQSDTLAFAKNANITLGKAGKTIDFKAGTDKISIGENANIVMLSTLKNVSNLTVTGSKSYVVADFSDIAFKSGASASIGSYARITAGTVSGSAMSVSIGTNAQISVDGAFSLTSGTNKVTTGTSSVFTAAKDLAFGSGSDTLTTGSKAKFTVSGNLKFGNGTNKLTTGSSSTLTAKKAITFGNGSDTMTTESKAKVTVSGDLKFGDGTNKLTTGSSSTLTAKKSITFGEGNDTMTLGNDSVTNLSGNLDFGAGTNTLTSGDGSSLSLAGMTASSLSAKFGASAEFEASDIITLSGTNKVTTGTSSVFTAAKDLAFGSGSDTLTTGSKAKFTVSGNLKFGNGTNKLTTGTSSTLTAKKAITFGSGSDTMTLGSKAKVTVSGDLKFGDGTNKLTTGSSSTLTAKKAITFGSGNDTMTLGSSSRLNVYNDLDFGDGANTFSIGASSIVSLSEDLDFGKGNDKFTVGDKAEVSIDELDMGKGTDTWTIGSQCTVSVASLEVATIEKFSMGKNSMLYLGVDSYNAAMKTDVFAKYKKQIGKLA